MGILFDDETLERLTAEMMKQGMVCESGWTGYRALCMRRNLSPEEEHDFRLAFFTGAKCMFSAIDITLRAKIPRQEKLDRIAMIVRELDQFDGLMRERKPAGRPQ